MDKRINSLFIFFILMFLVIIARLFYWQIISYDRFGTEATNQRTKIFTLPSRRGSIMASDGSLLVANKRSYLVYAEPKKIVDLGKTQKLLADILDVPLASISAKFSDDRLVWLPIFHKAGEDKKRKIESNNLKGIGFEEEDSRYYPEASMAAHLLGFVGKDPKGEDKGYFGIEGFYNMQLEGKSGLIHQETDARGLPILIGEQERIEPENGRDLVLNIDKSIQFIIESKLKDAIEKFGAKGGWVIVMEPKTGAVLAMSAFPSYDPNSYQKFESQFYKNPAVAESYEPGSTFKVLVMGGALNDKKVKPSTEFNEDGPVEVGGFTIRTWDNKYSGKITATTILEKSSNVGMVAIGKSLGKDRLIHYIKSFGIGSTTGIDLEEETSPDLRSLKQWYDIDYATATFGQGIAVTPMQIVRAVASIANDGKLMEPHVVKEIIDESGRKIEIKPKVIRQVLDADTAHILSEMMVSAVDNGEAKFFKPAGYRIAGKTGTAQIPISGHYDPTKTIASFVGFAPVPDPRFVVLTTLREPSASIWGAETAAPLFFSIAEELFKYYGVSPRE